MASPCSSSASRSSSRSSSVRRTNAATSTEAAEADAGDVANEEATVASPTRLDAGSLPSPLGAGAANARLDASGETRKCSARSAHKASSSGTSSGRTSTTRAPEPSDMYLPSPSPADACGTPFASATACRTARWRADTAGGNRRVTSADAAVANDAPYFAIAPVERPRRRARRDLSNEGADAKMFVLRFSSRDSFYFSRLRCRERRRSAARRRDDS